MNVLPLFIDDWFSSQPINDMDGDEERGYFRLCCHAAKLEYAGLPNDQRLLANWSRLESQWNKQTRDKRFRSNLTSGQKILANFYEKDGRLFNKKVLERVDEFYRRRGHAQRAAQVRWEDARASDEHDPEHMPDMCPGNATRVGVGSGDLPPKEIPKVESISRRRRSSAGAYDLLSPRQKGRFDRFWAVYWRKVGRDDAATAFATRVPDDDSGEFYLGVILKAIEQQTPEMRAREPSKIPHPATWLNRGSMFDEPIQPGFVMEQSRGQKRLAMLDQVT